MGQCEMPGGGEALVHWRGLIEELAMEGAIQPLVAFDLDLSNMYGTIEWPKIRDAVSKHFQDAEPWVNWAHQKVESIELQGGGTAYSDRGAGQGDVYGATTSSLVLWEAIQQHRGRMCSAMESVRTGAVDEWYIDDGQGFVSVALAERWLKSIDQAIASVGGRKEKPGAECKSVARLICPAACVSECSGWESGYIERTCKVQPSTTAPKVLGNRLGGAADATAHFRHTSSEVIKAREAISVLEISQRELVFQPRCFDVSKVTYLVRCNGVRV